MVELLDIDLCPIEEYTWKPGEAVVMVDSQPNTGRHNFACKIPLYGVIDHHDTPGDLAASRSWTSARPSGRPVRW